jgi:hypothetical protein
VQDRITLHRAAKRDTQLTLHEIRGLLTRMGADLLRTLGAYPTTSSSTKEARHLEPRQLIDSMLPYVRMN